MVRNSNGDLILVNRPFHEFMFSKMASNDVKMSSGVTVIEFDEADISRASFKSQ